VKAASVEIALETVETIKPIESGIEKTALRE